MAMRSWLFVPGDSDRKLAKAADCGADAVIIDLEDAVPLYAKPQARRQAFEWLRRPRDQQRWVRINSLDTQLWREDLSVIMPAAPDGIVVPKASGPEQLRMLVPEVYEHEQRNRLPHHSTRIMPMAGETPASALNIHSYPLVEQPRMGGITWGAEDLATSLNATRRWEENGQWAGAFAHVRTQVLLAAHACGVQAVDTLYSDFRDLDGLARMAALSHADGFHGMLAIHPDQVPIINEAFSSSAEELAEARAIVEAFTANPTAGTIAFEGRMLDQPHLAQAKRVLGMES